MDFFGGDDDNDEPATFRIRNSLGRATKKIATHFIIVCLARASGEPTQISHPNEASTWIRLRCIDTEKDSVCSTSWHSSVGGAVIRY